MVSPTPAGLADLPPVDNLGPYLPSLIALDTGPLSLDNHFPFRALFDTATPAQTTSRAARQIGKTYQFMARLLIKSAMRRGYKSLVVLPLQEQADRLSSQICRPMIEDSPLKLLLRADPTAPKGSVRTRPFTNRSVINFGYPGVTADRIRSISAVHVWNDEAQDLLSTQTAVIESVQASFTDPINDATGTSKTLDTLLEKRWEKSSQAVWHIRCPGCGYDNRSIWVDGDAEAMLPARRVTDASENAPGTRCRGCGVPVSPRLGRWVHRYPERARDHTGYHLPQYIFPAHYAHPLKFNRLLDARDGRLVGWTTARFMNEALGEPYDRSVRLLTPGDLQKAAQPDWENTVEAAARRVRAGTYVLVVMGVDWGGGGQEGVSKTRLAVVGFAADGGADVFFGASLPEGLDAVDEGKYIYELARTLGVGFIAHDFNGAGATRESIVNRLGWPVDGIAPVVYFDSPGAKIIQYVPATGGRFRGFYHLSKPKSFQYVANMVRAGKVRFFRYDHHGAENPGLLHDWYNLMEHTFTSPTGRSVYQVVAAGDDVTTDFADACNMAISFMWEFASSGDGSAWPSPLG